MLGVTRSVIKQVFATLAASFIMMSCGTSFGWVAPTFVKLLSEDSVIPMSPSEASWAIAIIEFGNLWSPVPAGILADKLGRKPVALINGPISIASWAIILYFKSFTALLVARVMLGFVIGTVFTVVPMYVGEIASQNMRGSIITLSQASFWFGFVYEYVLGPYVSFDVLVMLTVCLPTVFLVLFSFQPESPHFYLMQEDQVNAKKCLMWLRGANNEEEVKDELDTITNSVREEMNNKVSFTDIIATPADRRALVIVQMVSAIKMMSGVAPILAYSTDIYRRTGFTQIAPHIMTMLTGLVLFLSAFFSSTVTDSAGRKPLLIISCIGCALSLSVVSVVFFLSEKTVYDMSNLTWLIPLCIILYNLFHAFGLDPVSMTYRVELFPSHTRSTAASLNTLVFTVGAFLTLKFYQVFADAFGVYSIFLAKDDIRSRLRREQWREQSPWTLDDTDPYIKVVRGKSKEWSNLEHSQPLKRSDEAADFPKSPLATDLSGLNMSNPISKYHCPINLLYGNNLTVKNYFLLVPRGNESCNDTLKQIQSVDDDKIGEMQAESIPPMVGAAQGVTVATGTVTQESATTSNISMEVIAEEMEKNVSTLATTVPTEVNVTTNETTVPPEANVTTIETTVPPEVNVTTIEPTGSMDVNVTFMERADNTSIEVVVEIFTQAVKVGDVTNGTTKLESTTGASEISSTSSGNLSSTVLSEEILRTLDKYCETFNLTDHSPYTINPVSISSEVNALAGEQNKQKRAPLVDQCINFNMSGDQNYTIVPVAIPLSNAKVHDLKKQRKRNLTTKRSKKRFKSVG